MKLATMKVDRPKTVSERRDGRLLVVSPDHARAAVVPPSLCPNLLSAVEDWPAAEPRLREIDAELRAGSRRETVELGRCKLMAPLPRCYAWLDGSAFLQHVLLVRKARGAEPPEDLRTIPLMYQGVSDFLLGPNDDIPLLDAAHGMDFEAEVGVILDEVPMGCSAEAAGSHVRLLTLMNDVSLRNLIPRELKAGFGFFHGKPASSFAPFAVTPDEAGAAWRDGRLHLDMLSAYNGRPYGRPNAGEMFFSFPELIAHAAKTRSLSAGTILGSGTVSNADESAGSSCLAERRMLELIKTGKAETPFMRAGDTIEIEMKSDSKSLFGKIAQTIVAAQ